MAALIRTLNQPQRNPRLERGNPVTAGLVFLNSGADLVDVTGNSKPSAVNAPARGLDSQGLNRTFNASASQYIEVGSVAAINAISGGSMTLLCAFIPTGDGQLITKDSDVGGRAFTMDIFIGKPRFYVNGGANLGVDRIDGTVLSMGYEYLMVVSYSPALGAVMYFNGAVFASNGMNAAIPTATTTTKIGARAYAGFQDFFSGKIGQTAIWNRALSFGEVMEVYAARWNLFEPPVRGIRFKPGSGGTIRRALYLKPFA